LKHKILGLALAGTLKKENTSNRLKLKKDEDYGIVYGNIFLVY
jgi:hypothetical protein